MNVAVVLAGSPETENVGEPLPCSHDVEIDCVTDEPCVTVLAPPLVIEKSNGIVLTVNWNADVLTVAPSVAVTVTVYVPVGVVVEDVCIVIVEPHDVDV